MLTSSRLIIKGTQHTNSSIPQFILNDVEHQKISKYIDDESAPRLFCSIHNINVGIQYTVRFLLSCYSFWTAFQSRFLPLNGLVWTVVLPLPNCLLYLYPLS
jgi:hypothetical protein